MGHLAPETLLDVAEGVGPAASAPHLEHCQACRTRVEALRRTLHAVTAVDMPEPSPLFWDHFSARVHEAVAAEPPASQAAWWPQWGAWRLVAAMSAAVVLLAAGLAIRGGSMEPGTSPVSPSRPVLVDAVAALDTVEPLADDASFNLLADLASDLDWNDAAEAGLAVRAGASDLALVDFSMAEREELQRLLTEELAGRPL